MKKLLCLVLCWVPILSFAQIVIEPSNFYWQRVVEYPGTTAEIHDAILKSGSLTSIVKDDSTTIVGRVENIPLRYARMNPRPSFPNKPVYFEEGEKFSGTLIYEIKEGRYRVTFKDLFYNSDLSFIFGGVAVEMNNKPVNDFFFKKNGNFRRGPEAEAFAKKVFDFTFSNSFLLKVPTDTDDEW